MFSLLFFVNACSRDGEFYGSSIGGHKVMPDSFQAVAPASNNGMMPFPSRRGFWSSAITIVIPQPANPQKLSTVEEVVGESVGPKRKRIPSSPAKAQAPNASNAMQCINPNGVVSAQPAAPVLIQAQVADVEASTPPKRTSFNEDRLRSVDKGLETPMLGAETAAVSPTEIPLSSGDPEGISPLALDLPELSSSSGSDHESREPLTPVTQSVVNQFNQFANTISRLSLEQQKRVGRQISQSAAVHAWLETFRE